MSSPEEISVKIVLIGEPAVGKTTLRQSFIGKRMEGDYMMTLGADIAEAQIEISDTITLKAQIWDLAGQENFEPLTRQFLQGTQGAIVVFDLTRNYTFDRVNHWLEMLHEENPDLDNNIPFIVVGNKEDLTNFINTDDDVVQGFLDYSNRHNVFSQTDAEYIKTSAKTGSRVEEAFRRLGQIMIDNFNQLDTDTAKIKQAPAPVDSVVEGERMPMESEPFEPEPATPSTPSMPLQEERPVADVSTTSTTGMSRVEEMKKEIPVPSGSPQEERKEKDTTTIPSAPPATPTGSAPTTPRQSPTIVPKAPSPVEPSPQKSETLEEYTPTFAQVDDTQEVASTQPEPKAQEKKPPFIPSQKKKTAKEIEEEKQMSEVEKRIEEQKKKLRRGLFG